MKLLIYFMLIFSFVNLQTVFAQKTTTGRVTDENGNGIPGVNVLVKGTSKDTLTDSGGNFFLHNVKEEDVLVFSYRGMNTIEKKIGESDNSFIAVQFTLNSDKVLERQRREEIERRRQAELESRRQAKLEKKRHAKLERLRREELKRQRREELESRRQAELERQRKEELERQREAELEVPQPAEKKEVSLSFSKEDKIAEFILPPPKPSTRHTFNPELFIKCKNIREVDTLLTAALDQNGYSFRSYFSVPNGFALVTQLEKIHEDGTSYGLPERWNISVFPKKFTIQSYLKALFFGAKGYFRVIVFVVTDKSFNSSDNEISRKEALAWLHEGNSTLPAFISDKKFTKNHRVVSLVYEFFIQESKDPILNDPGNLTGIVHLNKSNILPCIQTTP